jgi:hypothetical protein
MPTTARVPAGQPSALRPYSGTLVRSYTVDIPAEPGWANPAAHRTDDGHTVDDSGRDDAPRGGGWQPMEFFAVQPPLPGGAPAEFERNHTASGSHRIPDGGGLDDAKTPGGFLEFLRGYFPRKPNGPEDLAEAGAAGAAHGGIGSRGMDPSGQGGRRTVDGRQTVGVLHLGHTYTHPIERVRRPLHLNHPKLRRILNPSIARETGSKSPGGYSSQYNPAAKARTAGPRQPSLRRLIRPYGQAEYDEVSQSPQASRRTQPGPIGNGGW